MNTLFKLQTLLNSPVVQRIPGYFSKNNAPAIQCADGTHLSVQASENHYCEPRENTGPYTEVEVWCIRNCPTEITEFAYSESEPSGYVPIEQVVTFINNHGGFKE